MFYLKYLVIVIFIYLIFDIAEYFVLKYSKKIDYKSYFDYIKKTHKIFNKKEKENNKNNAD